MAEATGISVDTIRVWERRYGRPVPVRLPSGHRRYTDEDVRWMRRDRGGALARAPSVQGRAPERTRARRPPSRRRPPCRRRPARGRPPGARLGVPRGGAHGRLLRDAEKLGPRDVLRRRIAPLLVAAGRAWADGELEIRHEHFLTILLQDFLTVLRQQIPESEDGPYVLFATLAGELHGLGLHMAAVVAGLAGTRPRILGTDTPNSEIVLAAGEISARAVGVSVSLATGGVKTDRIVRALRDELPEEVELIVGGQGARGVRRGPHGVVYVKDLDELEEALRQL